MIPGSTKTAIADSFIDLLTSRPGRISVSDIAEHCGVSVQTFYNHFRNKDDLIRWIYRERSHEIASKIGIGGYQWRDALHDWLVYLRTDSLFVTNALSDVIGSDELIGAMEEITTESLTEEVVRSSEGEALPPDTADLVRIYCYGICRFLYSWLNDPEPMDMESVHALAIKSLPYPLHRYLLG
ncbi:MAG: TetR family transcriptional regulator [Thermoplasmata archaeon]|nr:TetR family transcriptional regulator [Thermoplasmata archaeon]